MRFKHIYCAVAVCLVAALTGSGQTTQQSVQPPSSYLFVSPNTADNLTLDQAIQRLHSKDQSRLIVEARGLSQCLGLTARIQPAIGNWKEGSEPSTVTKENVSLDQLHYQGAQLGSHWRQRSVLLFRALTGGPHRMYVLRPRSPLGFRQMSAVMERVGIAFRTLVRERSGRSVVYVVEMSHDLLKFAQKAARRMQARLTVFAGEGEFFGHDNREEADAIFEREIRRFEAANPGIREKCQ
ncbi:MAG: hypothetical protein ABIZ95_03730 [Pyrinomonadaceae bacterium]